MATDRNSKFYINIVVRYIVTYMHQYVQCVQHCSLAVQEIQMKFLSEVC